MFGFLQNLLPSKSVQKKQKRDPKRLAQEKEIARSEDKNARLSLASNSKTHQEILYYLAENDPSADVRKEVAKNETTPVHAAKILAKDKDEDVRIALAKRMIELLPSLSKDRHSQLYAYVVQALGDLALDEVLKIRKALSSALKDHAHTPPQVAGQLARDLEREVSEPILRFCAVLSDEDLLDILSEHPSSWAVQAIAGRDGVSAEVSQAVIATDDRPAGEILLNNEGAQLQDDLLKEIINKARDYPEWQKPIACRKALPAAIAKELATFAEQAVTDLLVKREEFDEETLKEINGAFKRRMEYAEMVEKGDQTAVERAATLFSKGTLTEEVLSDALAMRDREFVVAALAQLAKCPIRDISKVLEMKAPKPIVALTWHAGLSMRIALRFQQELGQVSPRDLLYPKGGDSFPLTDDEMKFQLEFLGLKAA